VKVVLALGIVIVLAAVVAVAQGAHTTTGPSEIVLEDLRFTPNRLDATAGETLLVRLTNQGLERHDLNFPSGHMPGLEGVEAILAPGESRTIRLRFDKPGTHTFLCSLPGHAAAGMTGAVFVRP
jgi:nitrite reductase (NO-forming)